jgi:hypothetical protein
LGSKAKLIVATLQDIWNATIPTSSVFDKEYFGMHPCVTAYIDGKVDLCMNYFCELRCPSVVVWYAHPPAGGSVVCTLYYMHSTHFSQEVVAATDGN